MTQEAKIVKPPLRTTEIAKRLGVSERAVQKWITKGSGGKKLKASRAGNSGMWFVTEEDLDEFMTTNSAD